MQSIKRVSFADRRETNRCNSSPPFSALCLSCLSKQTASSLPEFPLSHPLCGAVKNSLVSPSAASTSWKLKWMWVENILREKKPKSAQTVDQPWPTSQQALPFCVWVCWGVYYACVGVCAFVSLFSCMCFIIAKVHVRCDNRITLACAAPVLGGFTLLIHVATHPGSR